MRSITAGRYRYGTDIRYKPPLAALEDYLKLARHLGCERFGFVQPSAYGRDNTCMLDAMHAVGAKCRGIVDVDENAPDAELARLNAAGVRGVRVKVNPIKPPEPGFSKSMLSRSERLDARCAELGWMLDFLTPGWLTRELIPVTGKLSSHRCAHGNVPGEGRAAAGWIPGVPRFTARHERGWVKFTST
jgi:predicted TIM-barrel fold metal-dependent hydrolase